MDIAAPPRALNSTGAPRQCGADIMKPQVNGLPHLTLTRGLRALTHAETLEFVHHGRAHALYRAPRRDGGASILVKATDTRAPTARALAMLRGEYEIMRE